MADLVSYENADRNIEQGKSSLIWISSSGERSLKLASVSRIIPGQRTAVFQRYLCPEKDCLSFSLIYNSGKRSLDLICKDKVEAEVWIAGLKALISSGQGGRSKVDGWNDGGLYFDVQSLRHQCELQELELQRSTKKAQEAVALAAEESAKSKAAKEVIKSLTAQLKDIAERLPTVVYDADYIRAAHVTNGIHYHNANGEHHSVSNGIDSATVNGTDGPTELLRYPPGHNETSPYHQNQGVLSSIGGDGHQDVRLPNCSREIQAGTGNVSQTVDSMESGPFQDGDNGAKSRNLALTGNDNQVDAEWIEQYEPGVYITLLALRNGTRDLKRVRFSRRRFGEHQAETWWSENREKVYERYNVRGSDKSSVSGQAARGSEGDLSKSSQS
ncbi:PH, RCC1 and FYVE domains-containing protein 1-like isoform X3 [Cornus florida]|uniref:PH, RCC1 and FYVE domains-containing protein 1-like isoform X3 n=1 Tax=Cornus florida TaxID=4283 RepID=UPI00289E9F52|nr:PH, RCC1 and FYVE domains-containing protein 1-like isoform X3 [Cornus florida]